MRIPKSTCHDSKSPAKAITAIPPVIIITFIFCAPRVEGSLVRAVPTSWSRARLPMGWLHCAVGGGGWGWVGRRGEGKGGQQAAGPVPASPLAASMGSGLVQLQGAASYTALALGMGCAVGGELLGPAAAAAAQGRRTDAQAAHACIQEPHRRQPPPLLPAGAPPRARTQYGWGGWVRSMHARVGEARGAGQPGKRTAPLALAGTSLCARAIHCDTPAS